VTSIGETAAEVAEPQSPRHAAADSPPVVRAVWWHHPSPRLLAAASLLVGALLWEFVARVLIHNALFLAPLSSVCGALVRLARSGELAAYSWISFQEFALGFGLAAGLGIALGLAMAASRALRAVLDPWVNALQATPLIALGPLFVLWFGLGPASKVAVVFIVSLFPILVNTTSGVRETPALLVEAARSFGASGRQVYREVMLPAALPFIVAGLRLGVARGLVGVVVGELFASRGGLGYLIQVSAQTYDTAALFAAVLLFALAGVLSTQALLWLEGRLAPWRRAGGGT
jgi:NitT/TauT family transport system permease protein